MIMYIIKKITFYNIFLTFILLISNQSQAFEFEQCTWYIDGGDSVAGREGIMYVDKDILNGRGSVWKSRYCLDNYGGKQVGLSLTQTEQNKLKQYDCHMVRIRADLDTINNGYGNEWMVHNVKVVEDLGVRDRCLDVYSRQ